MKYIILITSLATLLVQNLSAQPQSSTDVLARAELSVSNVFIGDKFNLEVKISAPPGTEVVKGGLQSSSADGEQGVGMLPTSIEILNAKALNTIAQSPELLLEQSWELQVFDTGYVFIPALAFSFKLEGSSRYDTAYTDELLLTVRGIPLNDESELMPIKPIIKEGLNWLDFWPFYLAVFVLVAGLAFWRYRKFRRDQVAVAPPPPPKPPYVLALEKLRTLEERKLWQSGQVKPYYSELSHILRVYLEDRFHIPALESTTKQITRALTTKADFADEQSGELSELLQLSDLVKFARAEPEENLHQRGLERIRDFVETTGEPIAEQQTTELPEQDV